MTNLVEELATVLLAEAHQVQCLVPLLHAEERALLRADVAAIVELTGQKEILAHRLTELEKARRKLVARLAPALGVRPEGVTLSSLIKLSATPSPALVRLKGELRDLLATLQAANRRNGLLMERSLGLLRGLTAELVSVLAPPTTYAPTGRTGQGPPVVQLLDREA